MFEDVKSEKALRKLNKIVGGIEDENIKMPYNAEVTQSKEELKKRLKGNGDVQASYARRVVIGYNYAKNYSHSITSNLLLDDINNNNKIFLKSYVEKKERKY